MKRLSSILVFILIMINIIYSQNIPMIISPNGSEILEVGGTKLITWNGIPATDTVYSGV
jgi:hypothetical protein